MFLFKWLYNFFFSEESVEDCEINDGKDDVEGKCNHTVEFDKLSDKIVRKSGVITFLSNKYGLIDNTLYFDMEVAPKWRKLTLGETIRYAAVKAYTNEAERVIEIEEVEGDFDEVTVSKNNDVSITNVEDDSVLDSIERVLNGKISVKQGEDLFIHPLNIHCNLRDVKCEFVPVEGDWVSIVAEVANDPDALNLAGDILHIKYIKPLLIRNQIGTVTLLNCFRGRTCKGVIENEIFFSSEFCDLDLTITLGLQVAYMAIESDQGHYNWRALSVQPTCEAEAGDRSTETLELIKDKENIIIEGNVNIGPLEIGQTVMTKLTVRNDGKAKQVIQRTFWKTEKRCQIRLITPEKTQEIVLEPGCSIDFVFQCTAKFLGLSSEIFVFNFKNFKIGRRFHLNVTLEKEVNSLISLRESDNKPPRKEALSWKNFDFTRAVVCKSKKTASRFRPKAKMNVLGQYSIPENLFKVVLGEFESCNTSMSTKRRILEYVPCLKENLSHTNYEQKFHTLLYLEEIHNKIVYRNYDLRDVTLRRKDKYLVLDVSNFAGSRMLFPIGTTVVVSQPWSEVNTDKQVGFVQESRDGILHIMFHESFHARYDESNCDVVFQPIRVPFLRCHSAVDMAMTRLGVQWLFPTGLSEKSPAVNVKRIASNCDNLTLADMECDIDVNGFIVPRKNNQNELLGLKWFNESLNSLQKAAVVNALEGRCRPLPYVIFGPPGTGKTVTIVEFILQVYTLISDSRILVGTPSNSAADIICHYLISSGKFSPGNLVRILSRTRAASRDVPENIIPFCSLLYDDEQFDSKYHNAHNIRSEIMESIGTQRIIVSTCNSIGSLHTNGLSQGHFSHIIIDEAAQAIEPECLIPICFLDPKRGQVVLSGDTQQLGPVCVGFKHTVYDLSKSFLWRLCETLPYVRNRKLYPLTDGFDSRCITRLQVNYRSVPEILKLPSRLFYDSELIATVSQDSGPEAEIIQTFNFNSENRDKPPAIIFHGIRGQTCKEENSFSWYNPLEIWQSVCYLKRLYSINLRAEDVGIITPYQKQVEKLRKLLSEFNIPIPKIGSVEEFQGQERYAIILSTVRSSAKYEENTLGFLASPRRVNVAITRARAILIIVGDPYALRQDPYWSAVIQYCVNNNSCTGCSFENLFPDNDEKKDHQS